MKKYKVILIFLFSCQIIIAQTNNESPKYTELLNNSFQEKWVFFEITDTLNAIIIKHEQQEVGCGSIATASLSIVKVKKDTIRVISLCNTENYDCGKSVNIIPAKEPNSQVYIPSYVLLTGRKKTKMNKEERKKFKRKTERDLSIWHSNVFDTIVLRTTWGGIEK